MNVFQSHFQNGQWTPELAQNNEVQWVLTFGDRELAKDASFQSSILNAFPNAIVQGCSTSGEICDDQVFDNTMVLTAVSFDKTSVLSASANVDDYDSGFELGQGLASQLKTDGLKALFVLSDGQKVNGTDLVNGLSNDLPEEVLISGGLAGDDARFEETCVWHNEDVTSGLVTVCGFYGDNIQFGHGSLGGWDPFGIDRKVTRSEGNVLFELDGQPALELYKTYLGDFTKDLPSSALLFPLSLESPDHKETMVRTILNINEDDQSMIFAGDIPEDYTAKLMKANFERLIDGAYSAAESAQNKLNTQADLAILVSCVGRRLVLKQRVEDELEAVTEVINGDCVKCGFYSYGEISPLINSNGCQLHNQTMTITTMSEI